MGCNGQQNAEEKVTLGCNALVSMGSESSASVESVHEEFEVCP